MWSKIYPFPLMLGLAAGLLLFPNAGVLAQENGADGEILEEAAETAQEIEEEAEDIINIESHEVGDAGHFEPKKPIEVDWPHEGPFGKFDRAAAQRGLKVYQNVCATCHAMDYVAFRDLQGLGYSEAQVKKIAEEWPVQAYKGIGAGFEARLEQPGVNDTVPSPFANDEEAKAVNNGAVPPDLSAIIDARTGGADYVYSLLVGYTEEAPQDFELTLGTSFNPYFESGQISMARPLWGGEVEYDDGTEATVEQMAHDVTAFLAWAAEPNMEDRKSIGLKVMIYLLILAVALFFVNRRVWKDVKKK